MYSASKVNKILWGNPDGTKTAQILNLRKAELSLMMGNANTELDAQNKARERFVRLSFS